MEFYSGKALATMTMMTMTVVVFAVLAAMESEEVVILLFRIVQARGAITRFLMRRDQHAVASRQP